MSITTSRGALNPPPTMAFLLLVLFFLAALLRPVSAQVGSQSVLADRKLNNVVGARSPRYDDAVSQAECARHYQLVGCSCYSSMGSCDGSYPNANKCRAFNKAGGEGVFAYGRCAANVTMSAPDHVISSASQNIYGSFAEVGCGEGLTMTGCDCYSTDAGCGGAMVFGGRRRAFVYHRWSS